LRERAGEDHNFVEALVREEPFLPVFVADGRHARPVSDWSREPDDAAMAGELKAAIERSLAELPAEYRAVILLHDVDALPNEEAAGVLGPVVSPRRWPADQTRPESVCRLRKAWSRSRSWLGRSSSLS